MKSVFKKLLGLFVNFYKIVEENTKLNIIRLVGKDQDGNTKVFISPIGAKENCQIYPNQIINKSFIKDQFRPSDIKILESIIITEGDIFIDSKKYQGDEELYILKSILNHEEWLFTEKEIKENKEILNRLNTRYFKKQLNIKPTVIK